jgi:cysteine desulfurase
MSVYLDWNATTPPLAEVLDAMREAAANAWGNPASVHADGRAARARVEAAREAVAELAGVDPRDVVFTSGGTEANNLALRSAFPIARAGSPRRLLTSRIEHPSIVRTAEALEREGRAVVRWLEVRPTGHIDLEDARRAVQVEGEKAEGAVHMLAVQAVNHETGAIQPLTELARLMPPDAWIHVDAVQAWGKVDFAARMATTLSLAAHKIRGPKGVGALVVRPCVRVAPILTGGAQERGLRPGTVDPVALAGLALAATAARVAAASWVRVAERRDRLERALVDLGAIVNGAEPRAPHVSNVSFPGWLGPELVAALDLEGVSVSSGSACSAGTADPSPVIEAIAGRERAAAAVRFSLGDLTTDEEIDRAVGILRGILARVR